MAQVEVGVGQQAASTVEAAVALKQMIMEPDARPQGIRDFLDGLSESERMGASRGIGARHQRRLWELVDGFAEVTLADMVPTSHAPLRAVPHHGRNTLPVHTLFQKRFYRYLAADGSEHVGGANFQSWMGFTGPGYYVAVPVPGRPEVDIDYTQLPQQRPEGWPEIVRNDRGVSRFIYGHMIDRLRRVSEHVTIGRAARHGKDMNAWFTLCRPEQL